MTIYTHTLTSIMVLATIILLIVLLRQKAIFNTTDGTLFANLITKLTLPATIFYALAHATLELKYITIVAVVFIGEIILLVLAKIIGTALKLSHEQMGSFILTSVFGSSALLGYALISEIFPHNDDAIAEAVFVSELGVGLPLFTIGVFVAMHYGGKSQQEVNIFNTLSTFFRSPIFAAIVLGTVWSFLKLPLQGALAGAVFDAVHTVAKANTLLVTLLVGVSLHFNKFKSIASIIVAAVFIKLVLSPLVCTLPSSYLGLEDWQLQVILIESSMPSAMLSVALAKRYGCDATLASKLIFATLLLSIVTLSITMYFGS